MTRTRAIVALLAIPMLVAACSSPASSGGTGAQGGSGAAPSWPAPADANGAAATAGLSLYAEEHVDVHYHAHLDVIVNGHPVTVPAELGIDPATNRLAALHTHDATGILHVESAKADTFTLGQVLKLWGLSYTSSCVGSICASGSSIWTIYVNGTAATGGPDAVVLASLQEIALVYGDPATAQHPAKFDFAGAGISG